MRTMRRVGVVLLTALALSTSVFAQSSTLVPRDRFSTIVSAENEPTPPVTYGSILRTAV
jgi:hypothetical protein